MRRRAAWGAASAGLAAVWATLAISRATPPVRELTFAGLERRPGAPALVQLQEKAGERRLFLLLDEEFASAGGRGAGPLADEALLRTIEALGGRVVSLRVVYPSQGAPHAELSVRRGLTALSDRTFELPTARGLGLALQAGASIWMTEADLGAHGLTAAQARELPLRAARAHPPAQEPLRTLKF